MPDRLGLSRGIDKTWYLWVTARVYTHLSTHCTMKRLSTTDDRRRPAANGASPQAIDRGLPEARRTRHEFAQFFLVYVDTQAGARWNLAASVDDFDRPLEYVECQELRTV